LLYWDTSALIQLYVAENDSAYFLQRVAETDEPIVSASIATTEVLCVLHRKEHLGGLKAGSARRLFRKFGADVRSGRILLISYGREVEEQAEKLLGLTWVLTWGIVYEFLRLVTHRRMFRRPLSATQALTFLDPILGSELVSVLGPTERHEQVMRSLVRELGRPAGNLFHDLETVVIMREHGVGEIMTADTDFKKFSRLIVTNPLLDRS
jgi:predicted nucleic acid-binding protein